VQLQGVVSCFVQRQTFAGLQIFALLKIGKESEKNLTGIQK
jgi:hypothetical protein